MQKKLLNYSFLLFFTTLAFLFLKAPVLSQKLALEALCLWYQKMLPALLPFMILSTLLIKLGLSENFAAFFSPVLRPLFRLNNSCLYCIVIGFLCGFPMGAKVCAQSLKEGKLSKREASLLLSFCNNIGPVYFTGYVLHLFPASHLFSSFFCMYGIPLLYGVGLRYTLFRDIPVYQKQLSVQNGSSLSAGEILSSLHISIQSAIDAAAMLGGYMVICNLFNLIPALFGSLFPIEPIFLAPLFEITSGLSKLPAKNTVLAFSLLQFGGLSCIAQTYSCIHDTGLSLRDYTFHKMILSILAAAFGNLFF